MILHVDGVSLILAQSTNIWVLPFFFAKVRFAAKLSVASKAVESNANKFPRRAISKGRRSLVAVARGSSQHCGFLACFEGAQF